MMSPIARDQEDGSHSSESSTSGDESSSEDLKKPQSSGFPFITEASSIPYRSQQVLISWIFLIASVALLLDFGALQTLLHGDLAEPSYFAELCNWFGVISCFCWLGGFILLAHWLHSVGATKMGKVGCYFKVVAAIFFNLQPMTGTMNDPMLGGGFSRGGGAGLWWSNLTGILLFHTGNLISCLDFYLHTPPGADKSRGWCFHGNLPVSGMWVYQAATWFLVAANFLSCSFGGAEWAPLVGLAMWPVYYSQFLGANLLLAGTLIYTIWCAGFHNFSNPPLSA